MNTSNHSWLSIIPPDKRQESIQRVLEKFLPERKQSFERLARDGIIPVEMLNALFDTSLDPLDRQATMDRIFDMVDKKAAREQEERTQLGMVKKMLSEQVELRAQVDMLKKQLSDFGLSNQQVQSLPKITPSISVEPEGWIRSLAEEGIERGSDEWWGRIEKLTLDYWTKNDRRSLPISGKNTITLERITNYSRKQIYIRTGLGDKTGDTR